MNKLLLFLGLALFSMGSVAQIRFTQVDPANAQITIQNFGMMAVDIQQYRLCALFEYASLSSGNVTVTSGSLNLDGGATVTVTWNASNGFNTSASDMGLYLPMGSFSDPNNMVDFMQYGDFGLGRENVADQAELWIAGTFLSGNGPWNYTGNGTENTIAFWSSVSAAGCTAVDACNYNPAATEEDGSCLFVGFPCDDSNPETVDVIGADCTCVGIPTGCTEPDACNYDANAVEPDFSCYFPGDNCDDDNVFTINDVYGVDCVCVGEEIPGIPGCTATEACNYDMNATIEDGSCLLPGDLCDDGNENTFDDAYGTDCVCAGLSLGCTLPDACNYDPTAGIEDGSCILPGDNCDDGDPFTFNDIYGLDCVCAGETDPQIEGCTAIEACNFNPEATLDNGSCILPGEPCDDGNEATVNDLLGADCVCTGLLEGCTDLGACNYDENAIIDNGTCFFSGDFCDDGNAGTENDLYNNECVCEGTIIQIEGCTAADACNFNPAANVEDGSCELPGFPCNDNNEQTVDDVWTSDCVCQGILTGCTDINACNYNPEALTDDFSCTFPNDSCDDGDITTINDTFNAECTCVGENTGLIAGCTDMAACNYDSEATIDDGSCITPGSSCDDLDPFTINDVIQVDCSCAGETEQFTEGCTAIEACNYDINATIDNGSCIFPGEPCDDANTATINDVLGADCVCAGEATGCTDMNACNYNMDALVDDGSCYFPGDNCDDDNIFTNNDIYTADCVCQGEEITGVAGCTAVEACNYNAEATIEDGSCELPGYPCDDANENTINDILTADCICAGELTGCTDMNACNYDASAIIDNGSCTFPGDACDDNNLTTDNDVLGADCVCLGEDNGLIAGCMDMNACNYDMTATVDNGSCFSIGDACDDGDIFTANDLVGADCICIGEAIQVVEGCTAIEACNYNPEANFDDGSCQLPGYPCDDNDPNTMGDAYGIDCVCSGMIVGCMDMFACNYNPEAQFDDFSCEFPGSPCDDGNPETLNDFLDNDCNCIGQIIQTLGCTDMDACNYDMSANTDDGSCFFVGDACDDGNANTSNDVYNANCQCEGVVSVEEMSVSYSVYPNPTNGIITIAQQEGAAIQLIEVVDITGKRVATFNPNSSTATIEMNSMAAGLYTLNIRSNNEVKSVRVQKN
ncbi:MAG: T9SS type A sorting domain-containing protein [Flavobacteriales bacterium]